MPRVIDIGEAFDIIKRTYASFGWNPGANSSRDQRNAWWAAAVAVVHFGHPTLNPQGGDPRWCLKNAGGGRPQSDDIIVDANTRAYFDLMPNAGTDAWSWNIGAHSEPLPPGQVVYPPLLSDLPGGTSVVTPPQPQPPPPPGPSDVERLILQAIGNMHAKLDVVMSGQQQLAAAIQSGGGISGEQMARLESVIADQAGAVLRQVVEQLGKKIDGIQDAQCVLRRR